MARTMVRGKEVIDVLMAVPEGVSLLVGGVEWTSLEDGVFTVAEDCGHGPWRFVTLDADQAEIDPDGTYEVVE